MRPVHEDSLDAFEGYDDEPSRLARVRRGLSTAIGAVVAVSLLLALGVWFYRLGVRDAESVPIIRASAEPAKTRPEDPGGAVAPHQDVTSYRVAESKPALAASAVIAPPPPEPKREDVPMGTLPPEPAERPEPALPLATVTVATAVAATAATAGEAADSDAPATAPRPVPTLAEAAAAIASGEVRARTEAIPPTVPPPLPAGETVLAMAEPAETALEQGTASGGSPAATPSGADPVPHASEYAPPLTPPVRPRPPDLKARMAAAVVAAEQNASELARRAAASTVQVQLAADPSEDVVRAMWRRVSQANSDLLHGRELAVQTTVSGGTTFYRLRVGPFGGVSEARAVCQALKARGQDCIVARNG